MDKKTKQPKRDPKRLWAESRERERGGERLNYFEKIFLRRICEKKYIKI